MPAHNAMSLSVCLSVHQAFPSAVGDNKDVKSQEAQHSQQTGDHSHRNPHFTRASEKKASGERNRQSSSAFKFLGVNKAL